MRRPQLRQIVRVGHKCWDVKGLDAESVKVVVTAIDTELGVEPKKSGRA